MSRKSLLDIIKSHRAEIASRSSRDNVVRFKDGANYIRIFPNTIDPSNPDFCQSFGMHYAKTKAADGSDANIAYVCTQNTFGEECPICSALIEAKARFKGDKAMEDTIDALRSTPRYLVNGILTSTENWGEDTKTQVIEIPQTVFDEICARIEEDMSEEMGQPLDVDEGYSFLVTRTGSGRSTKYSVSAKRKTKRKLDEKYINQAVNLQQYVDQRDETKRLTISKVISRTIGVPVLAPADGGTIAGTLDLAKLNAPAPAPTDSPKTIIDDAISGGKATEYEGGFDPNDIPFDVDETFDQKAESLAETPKAETPKAPKASKAPKVAEAKEPVDVSEQSIDDILNSLE